MFLWANMVYWKHGGFSFVFVVKEMKSIYPSVCSMAVWHCSKFVAVVGFKVSLWGKKKVELLCVAAYCDCAGGVEGPEMAEIKMGNSCLRVLLSVVTFWPSSAFGKNIARLAMWSLEGASKFGGLDSDPSQYVSFSSNVPVGHCEMFFSSFADMRKGDVVKFNIHDLGVMYYHKGALCVMSVLESFYIDPVTWARLKFAEDGESEDAGISISLKDGVMHLPEPFIKAYLEMGTQLGKSCS